MLNTYQANIHNQRWPIRETPAQRIKRLRESIEIIKSSGGNPAAYERVLAVVLAQEEVRG